MPTRDDGAILTTDGGERDEGNASGGSNEGEQAPLGVRGSRSSEIRVGSRRRVGAQNGPAAVVGHVTAVWDGLFETTPTFDPVSA